MVLVCWHLFEHRSALILKCCDDKLIALHNFPQLLDHGISMSLVISFVVFEVINIVSISSPIHLHSLKEVHKLVEVRLSIDTEHI